MSLIPDYDKWRSHYIGMINGKVLPNQNIFIVDDKNRQTGKGLSLITQAEQTDGMARGLVNKRSIKKKPRTKRNHSPTKQRTRQKSKPKTKTKKSNKKIVKRKR